MSVVTQFRANVVGNLSPTPQQRTEAQQQVQSNLRAKLMGQLRAAIQKATPSTEPQQRVSKAEVKNSVDSSTAAAEATGNQELGRDAFLQLLVEQLQNQDPLEPVDNSEMIAQLAEFSALEQQENLNANFEVLAGNIDQLNFISAQGLLGRYVEGLNTAGVPVKGIVESVTLDGSIVVLGVDGEIVPMTTVVGVAENAPIDAGESAKRENAR